MLIFIIGLLFSVVVGLVAVIMEAADIPVAPAIRVCCTAFGFTLGLWIAGMALWISTMAL
ncbi:hypothetical protein [Streptomyces pseudovenezuelae]